MSIMFRRRKNQPNFTRLPQTLKNRLNFLVELKPLFQKKFSRITNTISEQKKSQDNDKDKDNVTTDLYQAKQPDKPRII